MYEEVVREAEQIGDADAEERMTQEERWVGQAY